MPTKPADSAPDAAPDVTPDAAAAPVAAPVVDAVSVPVARYIVTHDGLGDWLKGQVVTADQLADVNIDRLLSLGALATHQE